MKKLVSILGFIFFSILVVGSFPSKISACSCAELPSVEEEVERSQAVFSGRVVDIKEKRSLKGYVTKSVLFEVTNTWKGVEQSQIIITTGTGGGDCGIGFAEGEEYLVYANESTMYGENSLVSTICDRTNKLSSLEEDLVILGEGQPPTKNVNLTIKHAGIQLYIGIAVVVVLGIGVFFILKKRKK